MNKLTDRDALGLDERVHRAVQGVGIERFGGAQSVAETAQQRLDPFLAHPLVECLPIVRDLGVRLKELRVAEDVTGDLDPIAGRFDDLAYPRLLVVG